MTLSPAPVPEQEGLTQEWVLVPRVPTPTMRSAFHDLKNFALDDEGVAQPIFRLQFAALLAASPTPPAGRKATEAERIVRAAICLGPAVYSVAAPGRHGDVMRVMLHPEYAGPDDQGFLTSTGRFVRRAEARQIAERAKQLLPNARQHHQLFSEDVWETPQLPPTGTNESEGK